MGLFVEVHFRPRGNTYLTSFQLVSFRHHGYVTSMNVELKKCIQRKLRFPRTIDVSANASNWLIICIQATFWLSRDAREDEVSYLPLNSSFCKVTADLKLEGPCISAVTPLPEAYYCI